MGTTTTSNSNKLFCCECKNEGLYYFSELDLIPQLWFSGVKGGQYELHRIAKKLESFRKELQGCEEADFSEVNWKVQGRRTWELKRRIKALEIFESLYQGSSSEDETFAKSPRYQKKQEYDNWQKIAKETMSKMDEIPIDLLPLILAYAVSSIRYLFVIAESIKNEEVKKHLPNVTHYLNILEHYPDLKREYFFEGPHLNLPDHNEPEVLRESDWACTLMSPKLYFKKRLMCSTCIQTRKEVKQSGLSNYVQLDFDSERKPLQAWTCLFDDQLFHYKSREKFDKIYALYMKKQVPYT